MNRDGHASWPSPAPALASADRCAMRRWSECLASGRLRLPLSLFVRPARRSSCPNSSKLGYSMSIPAFMFPAGSGGRGPSQTTHPAQPGCHPSTPGLRSCMTKHAIATSTMVVVSPSSEVISSARTASYLAIGPFPLTGCFVPVSSTQPHPVPCSRVPPHHHVAPTLAARGDSSDLQPCDQHAGVRECAASFNFAEQQVWISSYN